MWKILAFIFILIMCSSYCWVVVVSSDSGVDVLEAGMVWGLLRESSVSLISLAWQWCNGKDLFHKQVHESPGFCWILPMVLWVRNPLSLHGVMSEYWAEAHASSQVTGLAFPGGKGGNCPFGDLTLRRFQGKVIIPQRECFTMSLLLWVWMKLWLLSSALVPFPPPGHVLFLFSLSALLTLGLGSLLD